MLIITFKNMEQENDIADYEVNVLVNAFKIAGPFIIKKHNRDDGWFELVKKLVRLF